MINPWDEARRAWDRLTGHLQGSPHDSADLGEDALGALSDIGRVRQFLDGVEETAVAAARRHGRSWGEIAAQLGVARQSAWERWRELDPRQPSRPEPHAISYIPADTPLDAFATVPDVVHLRWDAAVDTLRRERLVALHADPDQPPQALPRWPNVVVTDQSPEAGAFVERGSVIRLWLAPGGGSAGMREPRRPSPSPFSAREELQEVSDEAVG